MTPQGFSSQGQTAPPRPLQDRQVWASQGVQEGIGGMGQDGKKRNRLECVREVAGMKKGGEGKTWRVGVCVEDVKRY